MLSRGSVRAVRTSIFAFSSLTIFAASVGLATLPTAGCGTSSGRDDQDDTGTPGGTGDGGAGAGGTVSGQGGGLISAGGGTAGQGGDDSCAGETTTAKQAPLDLYIMLDSSGSMTFETGRPGVSRWQAISGALNDFFTSPGTQEIGVGLQYFPQNQAGVPSSCTETSQCGVGGPCVLNVCDNANSLTPCVDASTCGGGNCVPLGECGVGGDFCGPVGGLCSFLPPRNCTAITNSFCFNEISCELSDYATPAVAINALNQNSGTLSSSIAGTSPDGLTPTAAALEGALSYAETWAGTQQDRKVVVVLATDGAPTRCDPQDGPGIAQIAAAGLSGSAAIPTFVVGILGANDQAAKTLLNQVAVSGGTTAAHIVDPQSQNLSQQFLDALDAIRATALGCTYEVPEPSAGGQIDYGEVNIEHTPAGGGSTSVLTYVGDESQCGAGGGWYYDVDPANGTPSEILLCDASCSAFSSGGAVQIRVGCETIVPK